MYVLDEKLGRRKLLKVAGAATAAAATGAGVSGCTSVGSKEHAIAADPAAAKQWGRQAGQWVPSCCNMCGGQSGIMVHVVNGVVEKIEPNNWNPNNYRIMPEPELLRIERGMVTSGWLDRPRVRVCCEGCGEGISYRREIIVNARLLWRPCAGEWYYRPSCPPRPKPLK